MYIFLFFSIPRMCQQMQRVSLAPAGGDANAANGGRVTMFKTKVLYHSNSDFGSSGGIRPEVNPPLPPSNEEAAV